jgi:uncharacterized protein (TIGR02001 family)
MRFTFKSAALGAATAVLATVLASSAFADGMPKRGSIKSAEPPPAPRACSLSANVALASEYVFRGVSQTGQEPALQGGFDATCGIFYAGVWASSLDWGVDNAGGTAAHLEVDVYAGIKPKTGPITWDLGVIYYMYPGGNEPAFAGGGGFSDPNFLEFKVSASGEIWKDGTLTGTVFYSPDYTLETGAVWTFEVGFAQALPKMGMFTPTISVLYGHQIGDDARYAALIGNLDDSYSYWNAGVTFAFLEKWSLDLRYWDSSLGDNLGGGAFCTGPLFQCDERFVATLKFTY